jgi:hypothetical protein
MSASEVSRKIGKLENPRHERFAQLKAQGYSGSESYRIAFSYQPKGADCANDLAYALASANVRIDERVAEIIAERDESELLSFRESRKYLADLVRVAPASLDEHSPLVQEFEITETTTLSAKGRATTVTKKRLKMPNKLQGLRLDAELMHRLDRRVELTGTIHHVLTADERARRLEQIIEKRAKAREIRQA